MTKAKKSGIIIISLLLSLVIFFVLLIVADSMTAPDKTNWKDAYVAVKDIEKGTLISKDDFDEMFVLQKIPTELHASSAISDKKQLIGNTTTRSLSAKEIVTNNKISFLSEMEYANDNIEDCTEVSVSFDSLNTSLAGKLRNGDIINLDVVTKNGGPITLAENVYISHAYDSNGIEIIDDEGENTVSTITVLISDADRSNFLSGVAKGSVYVSKLLGKTKSDAITVVYKIPDTEEVLE